MTELEEIIIYHSKKYPKLQPQDAVKLLYQNTFGGGHLITDEKSCRKYFDEELSTLRYKASESLYEKIGNGLVRVNLRALRTKKEQNKLFEIFLLSAKEKQGDIDEFKNKLTKLQEITNKGDMPFSEKELNEYLQKYEKAGYPMVSHSSIYRENYQPAYRVVKIKFMEKDYDL